MDRIESIDNELKKIIGDISVLTEKKKELELERASILFDKFCDSIGVSIGDIFEASDALFKGNRFVLCGPDTQFDNWVTVRKLKKDGTPYTSTNPLAKGLLKNYKVVGHIDL
jgi:hypothetical protein